MPLLRCRLAEKKQNWNFCSFCTRTLLPVTRDESGVRGQNAARAGAEMSSTTYRDAEPPAYNLHASPQPRARRTHPTRNIRNGPTKRLEIRNKAFPLDNMGSPPHVNLEPLCAASRFGFVEGEIFFPGLPFLTINPMFPVARARAARALEGRGEDRTRASALPSSAQRWRPYLRAPRIPVPGVAASTSSRSPFRSACPSP